MIKTIKKLSEKHNLLSTKKLKYLLITCLAFTATGCFKIDGVHYLNHHGNADFGGYVISMNSAMYSLAISEDPNMFKDLYSFSDPSITNNAGTTYISDTSGYAKMEHFYENFDCVPTPGVSNWSDCTFTIKENEWSFPNWSVNWQAVLHDEMEVLSSNHHQYIIKNGKPTLIWYFDGNKTSSFDINFTVRVPNEDY